MKPPRRLVPVLAALLGACADPAPPGSVPTAASSVVTPPPSASALAAPSAAPAPAESSPDHWSTIQRDPETEKTLAERREGMEPLVAVAMESDDGDEGHVFLEHVGSEVRGRWGDTVVAGKIEGGSLELKDVGTHELIFRGRVAGAKLEGTIRAEGEERRVRSAAPVATSSLTAKLSPVEGGRGVEIVIEGGKVKSAKATLYGRGKEKPAKTTAELDARGLVVTDERGTFRLFATGIGFIGRPPGQGILSASVDPPPRKVLPFEHGGVKLTSRHLKKGAARSSCDIDVELVSIAGTPHDAELGTKLEQLAVEAGVGLWAAGEAPPTRASFQCNVDALNDTIMHFASFDAAPLPGDYIDLGWSGYARWSAMTPPATSEQCAVLDLKKGEIVDVLATLPGETKEAVRSWADKAFRRSLRSRTLTRDDFFVEDSLESLESTSICATATGVRVLVPTGVITKRMPGPPYRFDVPKAALEPSLPASHVLRAIWGG